MSGKLSPLIVPVFLPHAGCPHRCVFCDQETVTGTGPAAWGAEAVCKAMETFGGSRSSRQRPVQIAFYGGNFLGLPEKTIHTLLTVAGQFVCEGRAHGIRFSTRPDTVNNDKIILIRRYPVDTVEIGAQSMSNRVLGDSRRGHMAADTAAAVQLLQRNGFETGIQMMVGLPGDDDQTVMASGAAIAALGPAFVRIYPTIVLAGSPLGRLYAQGRYRPLALNKAVDVTKRLWSLFDQAGIPVVRMGLQASADLDDDSAVIAGPYHPAFGHLVYEALLFDAVRGRIEHYPDDGPIDIRINPRNLSKVNGLNGQNRQRMMDYFHPRPVNLFTDPDIAKNDMIVNRHRCRLYGETDHTVINGAPP